MNEEEWESLCDRCGKCCVLKVEDVDTGDIYYTDVACKLLDCGNATCMNYAERKQTVPDCVSLTPENLSSLKWMPRSCTYRRLFEGHDLPEWHPLLTNDPDSTRKARSRQLISLIISPNGRQTERPDMSRTWWIMLILLTLLATLTIFNSEMGGPRKTWQLCKESLVTQVFTGACTLRFEGETTGS
jgi:uncharacterized cysteine cluster protein YcgN (CxxCxxCC family)